jgi:hypothetical protein
MATLQQGIGNRAVQGRLAGCPAIAACPTGGACHSCPFRGQAGGATFQAKLEVGLPGDHFEQEADRVADRVVGGSAAGAGAIRPASVSTLRRACADRGPDDERTIQRAPAATTVPASPATDLPSIGPGRPLSPAARGYFEPRFGRAFDDVRIHAGPEANASARAVRARAYTVGHDIAFAAGQYAPETTEGRRLLAHELTHVVQQTGATARLQRQPAGQDPTVAGPGPLPTLPSWNGCDPGRHSSLDAELAEAIEWVTGALADLQRSNRPITTTGALRRYLTPDATAVTDTIIPKLELIRDDLRLGPANFRCETGANCDARHPGADAWSGNPITLCPGYFDADHLGRVTLLVHEAAHNAGLGGDVYEWKWPFPGLDDAERLGNADSFAAFVRSNRYPLLPPVQRPMGINVGVGLTTGPEGVNYVVSAEYDPVVARRVFRVFDLHLGERVDFDTSGRFIGSLALGPRIFSPIAPGRTRLFLDLRVGAAVVVGGGTDTVAPATEARLGLGGNIGAAIGWQRVWDAINDNPNIDTFIIRGQIRW